MRPNFSSKETSQENYLMRARIAGNKGLFFLFLAVFTIGPLPFLIAPSGKNFIANLSSESFQVQLGTFLGVSFFLLFVVIISIQLFPIKMNFERQQTFNFWGRLIKNLAGLTWMCFAIVFIQPTVSEYLFPGGWSAGIQADLMGDFKANRAMSIGIIIGGLIFISAFFHSLVLVFRIAKLIVEHGTVHATFNQDFYSPGRVVKVRINDGQSANAHLKYRVHLSFVKEKTVRTGHGKNRKAKVERFYLYSDHQNVNPVSLSLGVDFTLPTELENISSLQTDLSNRAQPQYWELVVEEIDGYFFAGFNFDVR